VERERHRHLGSCRYEIVHFALLLFMGVRSDVQSYALKNRVAALTLFRTGSPVPIGISSWCALPVGCVLRSTQR
jgi:hypothetical protein